MSGIPTSIAVPVLNNTDTSRDSGLTKALENPNVVKEQLVVNEERRKTEEKFRRIRRALDAAEQACYGAGEREIPASFQKSVIDFITVVQEIAAGKPVADETPERSEHSDLVS